MRYEYTLVQLLENSIQKSEELGFDRIIAPVLLEQILAKKDGFFNYFMLYTKERDLNTLVLSEINHYDPKSVIEDIMNSSDTDIVPNYDFDLDKGCLIEVNDMNFNVSVEVYIFLSKIVATYAQNNINTIRLEYIELFLITDSTPLAVWDILQALAIDISDDEIAKLHNLIRNTIIFDKLIPDILSESLQKVDTSEGIRIEARNKEIKEIFTIMSKTKNNNVALIGDEKIGKTTIINKLASLINDKQCPQRFKNYNVIRWDLSSLFISDSGDDDNDIYRILKQWFNKQENIILIMDELPTFSEGSNQMLSIGLTLKHVLKNFLKHKSNRIIVAANEEDYYLYFEDTNAMPKSFERIDVTEPEIKDLYNMIKNQVTFLGNEHRIDISKKIIDYAILISLTVNDGKNPGKVLKIIEKAMITAKSNGNSSVSYEDVLTNSKMHHKIIEKYSDEDIKSTAFHEAGHYIVETMSPHINSLEGIVVSILPTDDFLGVTISESSFKKDDKDENWIIDIIATDLAGRVAESFYTNNYSEGACTDLEYATYYAEYLIMNLGMTNIAKNVSIDYFLCSEKLKRAIFKKVKKIIRKAYKRAYKILKENRPLLDDIVAELMDKKILGKEQLEELVQKAENRKNKLIV
ncbi:MAG: AAA family ATPase [Clostridia bacterium]|nr:AAA family ATPase [Clostridia bacterium]